LEEEELAEAKARAEQAAKEMSQVQTVESGIEKQNLLQASPDGKTKDSSKNTNDSTNDKGVNGGASVDSAIKRNSSDAAEDLQDYKADADTQNENVRDELMKDGKGEMVAPIANSDSAVQDSSPSNYEDETMKNSNVQILEDSKNGKVEGASNGENNDTEASRNEEGRSGDVGSNADAVNGCEAEESNNRGNDEHAEHTEDGKAQEAHNTENSINVEIHGDKDGKAKEEDINAEQSQADAGSNGKAEDDEHNANTKGDVDSGKNRAAEKGKTDDDVKGNSDGDS
jgi:hypothetical protein